MPRSRGRAEKGNEMDEITQVFRTKDGHEFRDRDMAERHEKMLDAKSDYESARRKYTLLLSETNKTADGVPFDLFSGRDYYWINPGYYGEPCLTRVGFSIWNCDLDDDDKMAIRYKDSSYRIDTLYYDRHKAEQALIDARRRWLQDRIDDFNKIEKSGRPPIGLK